MSDPENDGAVEIVDIDVRAWVEAARANPTLYRDRQVTEIVPTSIGLAPRLSTTLILKGGALMALAFKSDRVTGDVDFTAEAEPADFDKLLTEELDAQLPKAAIGLGYLDLLCRVQSIRKMPKALAFEAHDFPALLVRIGSAVRGSGEERRFEAGMEDADRLRVHRTLVKKCRTRGIVPDATSIEDPEVVRRARTDWATLALEVADLPSFDERFVLVRDFYISLPWDARQ